MMADTTVDKVKAIAKHLKNLSDEDIQMYIDDAILEVKEYRIADKYKERLQRYLAAHLASLDIRREESRSFEGASVTYSTSESSGKELDSTSYGQEFKRLLRKAQGLRLTVI